MGTATEIGKVRGLGSSRHGSGHWIAQRISAVGNIVLALWLAISIYFLPNFDLETVTAWLAQTSVAIPMLLLILCVFWHARLGLQVFIEDYVHDEGMKFATLVIMNFYCIATAAFGIFAVAKIAFSGAAA